MRKYRRSAAAVAVLAAVGLSQVAAGSASADEVPVTVEFTTTTQTIEYGQYWNFPVTADDAFYSWLYSSRSEDIISTGTPSGYTPELSLYRQAWYQPATGSLYPSYDAAPLGAGTYTFTISGEVVYGSTYKGKTPTPATLTVEKAKLGLEVRVLADPSNEEDAIVTAKFTGRFVDEFSSSFYPYSAVSPAGTWHIVIKDANGEIAKDSTIERTAGDDVLATSFFWSDAEPGQQYTATAEFTPSGASGNNFSVTAAPSFSYTAPEQLRPTPTSSATAKPDTSLPEAAGFSLPLWTLVLGILLILGLGVLVTILSVRLSRRPSATTEEVSA